MQFHSFALISALVSVYSLSAAPNIITTPVTDQGDTLQCWAVAATSKMDFIASRTAGFALKLSPKYVVYKKTLAEATRLIVLNQLKKYSGQICENCALEPIYYEQGGIFADAVESARQDGVVPEAAYPGFPTEDTTLFRELNALMDRYATTRTLPRDETSVRAAVKNVLDAHLGTPPEKFLFQGREFTPITFFHEFMPGWDQEGGRELNYAPGAKAEKGTTEAFDGVPYEEETTGDASRLFQVLDRSLKAGEPVLVQYKVIDEDHTQARAEIGFAVHGLKPPKTSSLPKLWKNPSVLDHYVLAVGAQWDANGQIERLLIKNTWGTSLDEGLGFHWMEKDYFPLIEGVEMSDETSR